MAGLSLEDRTGRVATTPGRRRVRLQRALASLESPVISVQNTSTQS